MKNQKHTVRKVIDYIEEHLEEKLNLEQIAEHAGYSRFHLNRIFMEETGDTIHKYVQERRLTMAAEKLVDTDMDITQIAYDAGYQSQQAFSLAFKQVYLCPPGAYRKRGSICLQRNGFKCIKLPVLQYMEFVTEEWEGLQREHHTLCD